MNISGLFIRRPVTTTLVMVGILIFGMLGYKSLAVSDRSAGRTVPTRSRRS